MALNHIHFNVSVKNRKDHGNGKSTHAVGSAAYRYKTEMVSSNGKKYNYSKGSDEFIDGFFLMPKEVIESIKKKPTGFARMVKEVMNDKTTGEREKNAEFSLFFWEMVEATEKRKDAQLFREVQLSLYHNLTYEENVRILKKFISENFISQGMIADVAIHDSGKMGKDGKNTNLHAHIALSMRDFDVEKCTFGKKNREWNNRENVEKWRKSWADISNEALEMAGKKNRVEHKSFKRLAVDAALNDDMELAKCYVELHKNRAVHFRRNSISEERAKEIELKKERGLDNQSEKIKKINKNVYEILVDFLEDHIKKSQNKNRAKFHALGYYKLEKRKTKSNKYENALIFLKNQREKLAKAREVIFNKIKRLKEKYEDISKFNDDIFNRTKKLSIKFRENTLGNNEEFARSEDKKHDMGGSKPKSEPKLKWRHPYEFDIRRSFRPR